MKIHTVLTVLGVSLAFVACNAKTAQVPRVSALPPVDASGASSASSGTARTQSDMPRVADFAPADLTFKDIQLFLWKEDSSPEDENEALSRIKDYHDGVADLLKIALGQNAPKA